MENVHSQIRKISKRKLTIQRPPIMVTSVFLIGVKVESFGNMKILFLLRFLYYYITGNLLMDS